jgi:hypothetical protein
MLRTLSMPMFVNHHFVGISFLFFVKDFYDFLYFRLVPWKLWGNEGNIYVFICNACLKQTFYHENGFPLSISR